MIRVVGPDPRLRTYTRDMDYASRLARRAAGLLGSSEIQQWCPQDGAWETVDSFARIGGRVTRTGEAR
jgi:hypothetical protein